LNKSKQRKKSSGSGIPVQRYVRAIAVVGDTHIGSAFALFPKEFTSKEGNVRKANEGQLQLLAFWEHFLEKCNEYRVDTVIHLADALDGIQPGQRKSAGLIVNDLTEQRDIAISLFKPLVKNRVFIMCSGSQYHESVDFEVHKDLVDALRPFCKRAIFAGAMGTYKVRETGQIINIAHGVGASFIYRGQLLDREVMYTKLAEVYGKIGKVDIILRGHLHFFHRTGQVNPLVIQVPCWKLFEPNRFTVKLFGRYQPDIGGIILLFTEKGEIDVREIIMQSNPKVMNCLRSVEI